MPEPCVVYGEVRKELQGYWIFSLALVAVPTVDLSRCSSDSVTSIQGPLAGQAGEAQGVVVSTGCGADLCCIDTTPTSGAGNITSSIDSIFRS